MTQVDERDLATRFAAGDRDALAQVYDQWSPGVWAVAMKVLGNRALAEDAVNEAFLRAWRSCRSFDPNRPLGPWLCTVARRAAIDLARAEFRPTRGGHAPEQDGVTAPPDLADTWMSWEVQAALAALPDDERVVVQMAHWEGWSQSQIAARLDVPIGTVKSRSHRAHRRLAARLAHVRQEAP